MTGRDVITSEKNKISVCVWRGGGDSVTGKYNSSENKVVESGGLGPQPELASSHGVVWRRQSWKDVNE